MIRSLIAFAFCFIPTLAWAATVTAADQNEILSATAALLRERYVDPELGERVAADLTRQADRWRGVTRAEAFAGEVTAWLRTSSGDGHLALGYSAQEIPTGDAATFSAAEVERYYGGHLNHGVQKIERLDGNIMLLDLRVFPPTSMAADVISAAMTLVAQGDALIIDLRSNGGGMETANLITGYLLDEPSQALSGRFDRPSGTHHANMSPVWVPGRRFGGTKPLYILTSSRTFSAAEAVAYDLQALGRAVIVGERTGGGANPFEYRRVHPHFALSLPESRSINPHTGSNWQGTGVTPDIAVPASEALERAASLARDAINNRAAEPRQGGTD